jgi:hypothetical protein
MPFVRRDENGNITALFEQARDPQTESVAVDHPDVKTYLEQVRRIAAAKDLLSSSDAETVRVIEDLIDVLVDRRLIMLTDLPVPAQQKIINRQSTRQTLNRLDNMMVDADDIL